MQAEGYGKGVQAVVRGYLVALLLALVAAGILLIRGGRNWGYGDWLINYQGGFVRRGLMGQICFLAGRALHLDPLYVVAAIGIGCYAVLFACVGRLLAESSRRWWVVALMISPAMLAFPVISRTSFRKEILYFALLAMLIVWLRRHADDPAKDKVLACLLSVALPVLILSHEPLVAYFPYLAAALLIALRRVRRVAAILAVPVLLTAVATGAVLTHIGDAQVVQRICASLGDADVAHCSEAVQTLAQTRDDAREYVATFVVRYGYLRHYPVEALLGLIPVAGAFLALRREPRLRRPLLVVLGAVCVSFPLSLSLYRYGVDWGRWTQMHLMSLCLLLLLIDAGRDRGDAAARGAAARPVRYGLAMAVFLVAYATCWSMPGVKDKPLFGYVSLANRLVHWNGSLTN